MDRQTEVNAKRKIMLYRNKIVKTLIVMPNLIMRGSNFFFSGAGGQKDHCVCRARGGRGIFSIILQFPVTSVRSRWCDTIFY